MSKGIDSCSRLEDELCASGSGGFSSIKKSSNYYLLFRTFAVRVVSFWAARTCGRHKGYIDYIERLFWHVFVFIHKGNVGFNSMSGT